MRKAQIAILPAWYSEGYRDLYARARKIGTLVHLRPAPTWGSLTSNSEHRGDAGRVRLGAGLRAQVCPARSARPSQLFPLHIAYASPARGRSFEAISPPLVRRDGEARSLVRALAPQADQPGRNARADAKRVLRRRESPFIADLSDAQSISAPIRTDARLVCRHPARRSTASTRA